MGHGRLVGLQGWDVRFFFSLDKMKNSQKVSKILVYRKKILKIITILHVRCWRFATNLFWQLISESSINSFDIKFSLTLFILFIFEKVYLLTENKD